MKRYTLLSKLNHRDKRVNLLLVFLLLILGFLFFFKEGVVTSADSGIYLNQGLRLYKGLGYAYLYRGPIFPLLIAGSFYLFDVSVKSAFLVVRLFFVFCLIIAFLLTLKLYGRWAAIIASLLIMTSFGINRLSENLLIDTLASFSMLLFIYILYEAFNKKRTSLFIASGICLGISLLVKEVSIILLPLPILLIIIVNEYRNKKHFASCLLIYLSVSIVVIPWVIFILLKNGSISQLVSLGGSLYLKELFPHGSGGDVFFYQYILNIFKKLLVYYNIHIKVCSFFLAPIFILSWLYLIIRAIIFKNKEDLLLVSFCICILPLQISVGGLVTRLGQTGIYFIMSYIVISKLILSFTSFVFTKFKFLLHHKALRQYGKSFIVIIIVIIISGGQLYIGPNPSISLFIGKKGFANTSFISKKFTARGRHNDSIKGACNWINQNIGTKESKLITSASVFLAVDFFTDLNYKNVSLSIFKRHSQLKKEIHAGYYNKNDNILFIFPHQRFGQQIKRLQTVYFIFEKDLLASLKEVEPNYLIVSLKEAVLRLYLEKAKWADDVFTNNEVNIYKINPKEISTLDNFNFITSNVFKEKLEIFKINYPDEYEYLKNILSYFNLKDEDLYKNSYENYQINWVRSNIPSAAKIACFHSTGRCEIAEEGNYHITINKDNNLAYFRSRTDYLFIHNSRIRKNQLPMLFEELNLIDPFKIFPQTFYFGDGWQIYKLEEDGGKIQ